MSIKDANSVFFRELTSEEKWAMEDPDFDSEEEDVMAEGIAQFNLINDRVALLREHFRGTGRYILGNVVIIQPGFDRVAPDLAVFENVSQPAEIVEEWDSWDMSKPNRSAPTFVLEIGSVKTWKRDLYEKPTRYQQLGVREYFAFDPKQRRVWQGERLRGWRYSKQGELEPLVVDERGWIKSEVLQLWLADEDGKLIFYNTQQRPLLPEKQIQRLARIAAEEPEAVERSAREIAQKARIAAEEQALAERISRENEQKARLAAEEREASEQKARLAAEEQALTERTAKEVEQKAMQALIEKLRKRGIDPDKL